jgi:hypothetical protein
MKKAERSAPPLYFPGDPRIPKGSFILAPSTLSTLSPVKLAAPVQKDAPVSSPLVGLIARDSRVLSPTQSSFSRGAARRLSGSGLARGDEDDGLTARGKRETALGPVLHCVDSTDTPGPGYYYKSGSSPAAMITSSSSSASLSLGGAGDGRVLSPNGDQMRRRNSFTPDPRGVAPTGFFASPTKNPEKSQMQLKKLREKVLKKNRHAFGASSSRFETASYIIQNPSHFEIIDKPKEN